MAREIIDEFTKLPITRQRKWQLRRKNEHRCVICGSPDLVTLNYCEEHSLVARERSLTWRRIKNGQDPEAPLSTAGRPRKF